MSSRRQTDATPASRREVARLAKLQSELRADFQSLSDDFNNAFDRLSKLMLGVQEEVRRGNLTRLDDVTNVANRFMDLERQVGETRDRVNAVITQVAGADETHSAAAAEGAARGAVQGVTAAQPKRFLATWKGWIIAAGAAIGGVAGVVNGAGPIVRFFAGLFDFLGKLK